MSTVSLSVMSTARLFSVILTVRFSVISEVVCHVCSEVVCCVHRETDQGDGVQNPFLLHPWLRDEEREEECLRQLTEALLLILLLPAYARCDSHRHLLREIISTSGMQLSCNDSLVQCFRYPRVG